MVSGLKVFEATNYIQNSTDLHVTRFSFLNSILVGLAGKYKDTAGSNKEINDHAFIYPSIYLSLHRSIQLVITHPGQVTK